VAELRRLDWSVVCVTRRPLASSDRAITWAHGDLCSPESLQYARDGIGPVDAVFHLAARLPTSGGDQGIIGHLKANVLGTAALLESFIRLEASRFVYASSVGVIGKPSRVPIAEDHPTRPTHPYHVSKLAAELVCEAIRRSTGGQIVSLRITSPYGPGMSNASVLPRFLSLGLAGKEIPLFGSGGRRQNFVHVSDVTRACILAAQGRAAGVYNIGGASATSMRELADLVVQVVPNSDAHVAYSDVPDPQEGFDWDVDLSAARRALGYEPRVSLRDGIHSYVGFLTSGRRPAPWSAER
jgi:UDP-glucose 4-epimerase